MSSIYRIGDLTLDVGRQELKRGAEPIHLGPLTWRVLLALIERAPDVVTHDQLAEAVWVRSYARLTQSQVIFPPFGDPDLESAITGMSPDRTSLLITSAVRDPSDFAFKLWLLPVVGGAPRLLGDDFDGVYSPDGTHLLYTDGYAEVWIAAHHSPGRKEDFRHRLAATRRSRALRQRGPKVRDTAGI